MKKIPKDVNQLYAELGFRTKLYIRLRWKLCPFEKIETFLPKQGTILDIGCGYGLLANFLVLKSSARQVIGIDKSSSRVIIAQKTVGQRKNIKFIQNDIQNLDLPKCQVIVMSDFLHHLSTQVSNNLLIEAFNALDKGGRLVIQDVDSKPYWKYLITLGIDRILNLGQNLYYQPSIYWQNLLEGIGFKVKVIPAHKGLPLADNIFICTKP